MWASKPGDVINPPRELTDQEKTLLGFLLSSPFPGRDELLKQAEVVKASGTCLCGCPTIDLKVDPRQAAPAVVRSRVPVEANGFDTRGDAVLVMLFVDKGYMSMLEVVAVGEPDVAVFPQIGSLQVTAEQ